jgi:hypothetical protein
MLVKRATTSAKAHLTWQYAGRLSLRQAHPVGCGRGVVSRSKHIRHASASIFCFGVLGSLFGSYLFTQGIKKVFSFFRGEPTRWLSFSFGTPIGGQPRVRGVWLADILVNPHDKGNQPVAVILWGEQGAGKTCLRELMSHLIGARLVHHTDDPLKNGDIMAMAATSTRLSSTSCSSSSRRSTSRRTVRSRITSRLSSPGIRTLSRTKERTPWT